MSSFSNISAQTASIVLAALSKNDAGPGISVLDLGCGTGMLGLGFALVQSDIVYLVDCDSEALELARENVDFLLEEELIGKSDDIEEEDCCLGVELIAAKVKYVPQRNNMQGGRSGGGRGGRGGGGRKGRGGGRGKGRGSSPMPSSQSNTASIPCDPTMNNDDDGIPLPSKIVDTVITNPPFGTKNNEGIDVQFLRTAIRLARRAVYSFHKTSTRPYLIKLLRDTWGLNVEVVAEMKFDIPNMYKFHKQKCVDVEVDLIRVFWDDDKDANYSDRTQSDEHVDNKCHDNNDSELGEDDEEEESEGEEMPLGLCGHA